MHIVLLAGLGYGDEGKGTITDFLTHNFNAKLVVRYNGGPQAGHHVAVGDGRQHIFSQFGSGTFAGAATHLSKHMLVDLLNIEREAASLQKQVDFYIFDRLTIHKDALLITPYHKAVNRIKEVERATRKSQHGSCGMGVGEARSYSIINGKAAPTVGDLLFIPELKTKLADLQGALLDRTMLRDKLPMEVAEHLRLLQMPVENLLEHYTDILPRLTIVDDEFLELELAQSGTIIFEGAQGVLLDESYGFQPYTTWTNTTFENAYSLLANAGCRLPGLTNALSRIGVMRTFSTRHGAGPFVTSQPKTEAIRSLGTEHNATDKWQGYFRTGPLDLVATKYAAEVLGDFDAIALTHMDCLPFLDRVCQKYEVSDLHKKSDLVYPTEIKLHRPADWIRQEALAEALMTTKPIFTELKDDTELPSIIEEVLGKPITIRSGGRFRAQKIVK